MCPTAEKAYQKNLNTRITTQVNKSKILDVAKEYVLKTCNVDPEKYKVFFTSGEIESNRLILCCAVNAYRKIRKAKPHVVVSTVEHDSLIDYAKSLYDSSQIELTILKPNAYGCILSESVKGAIKPNTCMMCVTYVNRELGSVNNIQKISEILHENKIPIHSDCSYIFGKYTLDITKTNIDSATIAFDKINGPIGVGALIINNDLFDGYKLNEHSSTLSGKREYDLASITAGIEAAKVSVKCRTKKNKCLLKLRNYIINEMSKKCEVLTFSNFMRSDEAPLEESKKHKNRLVIMGPPVSNESYYVSNILSFILIGAKQKPAKKLQDELEAQGIIVGVPDAEKNYFYREIGLPEAANKFIMRISLSDNTTEKKIEKFVEILKKII
jgi:cysteine sulfinate desulfinase/cysteine desulfurase-like protein